MKLLKYIHFVTIFALLSLAVSVQAATRWRVRQVKIEGNETFRRGVLLGFMELRPKLFTRVKFTDSRLRSDISSLEGFYRSQGFLNVEINPGQIIRDTSFNRVSFTIEIVEGERTTISSVEIIPGKSILDSSIFRSLWTRAGRPLITQRLREDANFIENEFASEGYLEATVDHNVLVDSPQNIAKVTFEISKGPQITVDDINIKGVRNIRPAVIKRELAFKKGDLLTIDRLRKSERQLYRTNLFSRIQIEPVLGDSATKTAQLPDSAYPVKVTINEADFFRVELGLGYGSETYFRSSLKTSYSNLFGLGHKLALNGNLSQRLQRVESIYTTLWLLGLPLQFDGSIYYNRHDDRENTYFGIFRGIRLSAGRQVDDNLAYQFWLRYEDVDILPVKNTQSIGSGLTFDTRDDLIDPTRGTYNIFQIEAAGLTGDNSSQFVKITHGSRFYWRMGHLQFASGLKFGWARPYGATDTVPTQERFFGGGPRSVRGFNEGHLIEDTSGMSRSGNVLFTANVFDMRFPLFWWFNGAVFLDAGNIWNDISGESAFDLFRSLRWSAGPGIRLNTPIAVLRFDAGFKLGRRPGESLYVLHFDVGQPF